MLPIKELVLGKQDLKNMNINYYKYVYPNFNTAMGEAIEDEAIYLFSIMITIKENHIHT
jgi:hypothetical protein